jgi:hypothetical protein
MRDLRPGERVSAWRRRSTMLVIVALALSALALVALPGTSGAAATSTTCPAPLEIGVSYLASAAAAIESTGQGEVAAAVSPDANTERSIKDYFTQFNADGGLNGCDVTPVIHPFQATTGTFAESSQSECVDFTQDHKVRAAILAGYETKVATDCLVKAKVPVVGAGNVSVSPQMAKDAGGLLVDPNGISVSRWGAMLPVLQANGSLTKSSKVGILVADSGTGSGAYLADKVWKPGLKKLGIPVVSEFTFTAPLSVAGAGASTAQLSSAILQFKNAGVNTVLATQDGGLLSFWFIPQAKAQNYSPKYVYFTSNGPAVAATIAPDQLSTATLVSWTSNDVSAAEAGEKLPANEAATKCSTFFAKYATAGATQLRSGNSPVCDGMAVLAAAWKGASDYTGATFTKGLLKNGKTVQTAAGFEPSSFAKGKPDGGVGIKLGHFDVATKAWLYDDKKVVAIP